MTYITYVRKVVFLQPHIICLCYSDVCLQTLHETSLRFDFAGYRITAERFNFRRFQVVYTPTYIMYFNVCIHNLYIYSK